jgi:branched-chain amino acid transport system permease protein
MAGLAGGVVACAVGFPALRVKGLMLVVATLAFGESGAAVFFNFTYQMARGEIRIGPHGGEGFKQIRYFPENGWTTFDVVIFIWVVVALGWRRCGGWTARAPARSCAPSARTSWQPKASASHHGGQSLGYDPSAA